MKALALCLLLLATATLSQAQKFISEKSKVTFFSKATIEDIAAHNEKSMGLFDPTTGDAAFFASPFRTQGRLPGCDRRSGPEDLCVHRPCREQLQASGDGVCVCRSSS